MEQIKVEVPSGEVKRVDSFLASGMWGITRNAAQKLIESGNVLVDGRKVKKNHLLMGGETIDITLPEPKAIAAVAQEIPLDVVFEDDDVIVINKPRGLVVHPAPGHWDNTLVNALLAHCAGSLSGIGGERRPGIVHRIDKDTSGLIIAAKNDRAHLALASQLKDHTLHRVYQTVVVGQINQQSGNVCAPIGRSLKNRKKMAVVEGGREAVTHYEVLGHYPGYTHLRCRLETGRTHQIRVHMAYLGHPVAGDPLYGPRQDQTGLGGQCLHASELSFVHPTSGKTVQVSCPLPDYFTGFLERITP